MFATQSHNSFHHHIFASQKPNASFCHFTAHSRKLAFTLHSASHPAASGTTHGSRRGLLRCSFCSILPPARDTPPSRGAPAPLLLPLRVSLLSVPPAQPPSGPPTPQPRCFCLFLPKLTSTLVAQWVFLSHRYSPCLFC